VKEYCEEVIKQLRAVLPKEIKHSMILKRPWSRKYLGLTIPNITILSLIRKKGGVVFVGNKD